MKWSWKIGRFAGIDVYMHVTFLLIVGFVALSYWVQSPTISSVLSGVGFILALFTCVVFHEYGHALTARKYGIKTRDITLYPIGGVARLERMPDEPRQELWVALAGPAVNVFLAGFLFIWLQLSSGLEPLTQLSVASGSFLERLMVVNIFLVGFNMIPAFPMDGGRVLRALLAMRLEYTRATQLAATLGQGIAIIFGFIGLFSNPFLVFIAFFVWIGAGQENSMVQIKSALGGISVSQAMITDFESLAPDDQLSKAVNYILSGSQQDFPVVENNQVVGVLTRNALFKVINQQGISGLVTDIMERDFHAVDSHDMLETAFNDLQTCQCLTMPVLHAGQLVGLLTQENIGEFISIRTALTTANA